MLWDYILARQFILLMAFCSTNSTSCLCSILYLRHVRLILLFRAWLSLEPKGSGALDQTQSLEQALASPCAPALHHPILIVARPFRETQESSSVQKSKVDSHSDSIIELTGIQLTRPTPLSTASGTTTAQTSMTHAFVNLSLPVTTRIISGQIQVYGKQFCSDLSDLSTI